MSLGIFRTLTLPAGGRPEINTSTGETAIPATLKEVHGWMPLATARAIVADDPQIVQHNPRTGDVSVFTPGHAAGFGQVIVMKEVEFAEVQDTLRAILARPAVEN